MVKSKNIIESKKNFEKKKVGFSISIEFLTVIDAVIITTIKATPQI